MALPTSMTRNQLPVTKSGIVVGVFASTDPLDDLELWRSSQFASTASSLWHVTRVPPSTTPSYTIPIAMPVSTRYQYFKARSQKLGFNPSTFTPIVRAKPVIFSQYPSSPNVPTNRNKAVELPVPILMNAAKTMEVGAPSQVTPTTFITKTIRIPHSELVPGQSVYTWTMTQYAARPGTANTLAIFFGSVVLPKGVTLTAFRTRMRRQTTADDVKCIFSKSTDSVSGTFCSLDYDTLASTATGWRTFSSTLASTVSALVGDQAHSIQVEVRGVAAAANSEWGWCEVDYKMPRYDKAY